MSDSEYEEEILVFADFDKHLLPSELESDKSAIKVIGLETLQPIAEVNGSIFKGTYNFSMGTAVFFSTDSSAAPSDPLFEKSCKQTYKYFGKTNKVINFERIYIESLNKENSEPTAAETTEIQPLDTNLGYQQIIEKFPSVEEFDKLKLLN